MPKGPGSQDLSSATLDELLEYMRAAAALFGWDGTDMRRLLVESTTNANLRTALYNGATLIGQGATPADAFTQLSNVLAAAGFQHLYNNATWDRERNNYFILDVVPLAARTATFNTAAQVNYNHRGIRVDIEITTFSGTSPTLTCTIDLENEANSPNFDALRAQGIPVATGAIESAAFYNTLTAYPGLLQDITTLYFRQFNIVVPRVFRLTFTLGGTTPSFTYAAGITWMI